MNRPEQPVQIAIVKYLRSRGFLFCSPDLGVNVKSERTRAILKAMGRTAGVSDLVVWVPGGTVCIEVKRPKVLKWSPKSKKMIIDDAGGKQSEGQKEFEKVIHNLPGHHYIIAQSVSDVVEYFKKENISPGPKINLNLTLHEIS